MSVTTEITYGTLRYLPGGGLLPAAGVWSMQVQPHVAIKLKRLFPRANQDRAGAIWLTHSDEIAHELDWVLLRYPLDISEIDRERLQRGARAHLATEQEVQAILRGQPREHGLLTPARPGRDYQLVAADLAITTGQLLITDELGLGKTTTGLLTLQAPEALPALVVCPPHLANQWLEELRVVFPSLAGHVVVRSRPYVIAKHRQMRGRDPDLIIMSYAKLDGWRDHLAGEVRAVIFDEVQELRHFDTRRYEAAGQVADGAALRVGLSATPIYNYGGEIWNVMEILAPGELGTREEFAREWCGTKHWSEKVKVADPAALGEYLRGRGLMIGRTRRDVGRELPELLNIAHTVPSDSAVLDELISGALDLAELILNADASKEERFTAEGQFDMRMRQATGIAKAPYVAEFVKLLLESEEKIVMWGWHRAVYDIWCRRLAEFNPVLYTGTESPRQKDIALAQFIGGERLDEVDSRERAVDLHESRVLIMSLRSGAGVNGLQHVCKVGVFGELDWSPKIHDQCSGRLHRDGQRDPVVAYFCNSDEGSDPVIMDILGVKRSQADPLVYGRGGMLAAPGADPRERIRLMARAALQRRARS